MEVQDIQLVCKYWLLERGSINMLALFAVSKYDGRLGAKV